VYGKDNCPRQGVTSVHAPFACEAFEAPSLHSLVEGQVSDSRGLFHAVYALHETHDPVLPAGYFETRGLLHEHNLVRREDTM
jgi:hypothetical protein